MKIFFVTFAQNIGMEKRNDIGKEGEAIARNLMESLRKSLNVPFERVLFALGIRYVGETVAKRLARAFQSMEKLEQATFEELVSVDEIGERIARSVIDYFTEPRNKETRQSRNNIACRTLCHN